MHLNGKHCIKLLILEVQYLFFQGYNVINILCKKCERCYVIVRCWILMLLKSALNMDIAQNIRVKLQIICFG
jgi:hypothetical protein